jgi:D-3-phosphoglycerate dehydrogenase / 2-oxoglutarate reductase
LPRVLVSPIEMIQKPDRWHQILVEAGLEVVCRPVELSLHDPDTLIEHLQGVDAILAGLEPLNRRVLESSRLRAIARYGVGYDQVDVTAATECGVAVCITPGVNQVSVAEHTLALILSVSRGFPQRDQGVRDGSWRRDYLPRLAGRTLGLVGLGRIGKAVVPRAQGLELKVIAHDPDADRQFATAHHVRLCSLDELWAAADIVSLHLPCIPATRQMINRETLARMRPGAILINTARGGLVDEDALAEALESGHLAGAGLDAFVVEPLPASSPLLRAPHVLFSPHIAGQDHESIHATGCLAAECLASLSRGRQVPAACLVNPEIGPTWSWQSQPPQH